MQLELELSDKVGETEQPSGDEEEEEEQDELREVSIEEFVKDLADGLKYTKGLV
jgi:hypothetical protein